MAVFAPWQLIFPPPFRVATSECDTERCACLPEHQAIKTLTFKLTGQNYVSHRIFTTAL